MTSSCKHSLCVTALLFQPRRCMATNEQQWEWAADQPRPPVATWRRVRGTRSGSCRAGSEAPSPLAHRGSCSCWWRRRSAGWSGRVRCASLWHASVFDLNPVCHKRQCLNWMLSDSQQKNVRHDATHAINCISGSVTRHCNTYYVKAQRKKVCLITTNTVGRISGCWGASPLMSQMLFPKQPYS